MSNPPEGTRRQPRRIRRRARDADRAIDFYKKAFGAEELSRMAAPGGTTIIHAALRIGDSIFFLHDEAAGGPCRSPESLGTVVDPFGHQWGLATHQEDLTHEQMFERARDFYERMGSAGA